MPASPARIGFVSEAFRRSTSQSTTVRTRYGAIARDTLDEPVETYFDNSTDAQAVADERFSLLSGDRRMMKIDIARLLPLSGALAFNLTAPTVTVIDDERGLNRAMMVTAIEALDYDTDTLSLNVWG
jgi:hypothetical protein